MKKGLILLNAYAKLSAVQHQADRLKEEFFKLGVNVEIQKNGNFSIGTDDGGGFLTPGEKFDFIIYLDKDKYVSAVLEKCGARLFNNHRAIEICDDKMLTHIALAEKGIPMPATICAPLCYTEGAKPDCMFLKNVAEKLGYPVIVKTCYGSRGTGVFKAESFEELYEIACNLLGAPHLYQRCVKESLGRDVRVIVIGGKAVAAMERRSAEGFRSNIEQGGQGFPCAIDGALKELAEKTAKTLNLDYCGVDILRENGAYSVCEVNSNAFFRGIESVTGINVARLYAEHIYGKVYVQ